MVTEARWAECDSVVRSVAEWAGEQPSIVAIGLAGSWARGNPHADSDVDIIVLTVSKPDYTDNDDWIEGAVGVCVPVVRRAEWGDLTERRIRLPSGLEVEFGFVEPTWADTDPADAGTAEVIADGGLSVAYDPDGLLSRLLASG